MRIIDTLDDMVETARGWQAQGTVGFLSVSGNLHEGHRALIQTARNLCEICVVCIISKTGFFDGAPEDGAPVRDLTRDLHLLRASNVDVVFLPDAQELYPEETSMTYVTPMGPLLTSLAEMGTTLSVRKFATTFIKLLQIVRPDIVFIGQKDALQIAIVRQLIKDLNIDVKLSIHPTVRDPDGLAISNRNQRLTPEERQSATMLYQALNQARHLIDAGERDGSKVIQAIKDHVANVPHLQFTGVYICHSDTFAAHTTIQPGTLIMVEARVGAVQLHDTIVWRNDGTWLL